MAKEVRNKVSLDATRFERGVKKVKGGVKGMEKALSVDFAKAARLGGKALAAFAAGVAASGAIIATGIKKVIELGAELDHLSTQTGIAVSQLFIMRQAFEDGGVGADKVKMSIAKMQRTIGEASNGMQEQAEALDTLGLSLKELKALSPDEQFNAMGKAIMQIEDPAMRANAAMEIFGRSGAELLTVFQSGAMDDAAASLGGQASILEKNSVLFERVSTLMGRAGKKIGGFFVGIADKVVPLILPLLEQLDALDLAAQGQKFGENLALGLRAIIGLFQQNTMGELIKTQLLIAGGDFLNFVAKGWVAIGQGLWGALKAVGSSFIDLMIAGMKIAAIAMGPELISVLSKVFSKIPGLDGFADKLAGAGDKMKAIRDEAFSDLKNIGANVVDGFADGAAKAEGFELFDTSGLKDAKQDLINSAIASVPAVGEKAAELIEDGLNKASFTLPDETAGSAIRDARAPLSGGVSSLAAIGGGGGVGGVTGVEGLVDESRKQTGFLKDIDTGITAMKEAINGSNNTFTARTVLA